MERQLVALQHACYIGLPGSVWLRIIDAGCKTKRYEYSEHGAAIRTPTVALVRERFGRDHEES